MNSPYTGSAPGIRPSRKGPGRRALTTGAISLIAVGSLMAPVLANAEVVSRPAPNLLKVSTAADGSVITGLGGLPVWFEDSNQVKIALCDDTTYCFTEADPLKGAFGPDNLGGELFYQLAEQGGVTGPTGAVVEVAEVALEGLTPEDVGVGPAVFGRVRVRVDLPAGSPLGEYTIIHPYGVDSVDVTGTGSKRDINLSDDVGLTTPGDFNATLASRIDPFLMPEYEGTDGPIIVGDSTFIADPAKTYKVTGSKMTEGGVPGGAPTNYFEIKAPDGTIVYHNDRFTVHGKLYGAGPAAPTAVASFSGTAAVGSTVTLNGSTSARATRFAWTGPAAAPLTGSSTSRPTFTVPDVTGALEFTLTASNETGSTTSVVSITPDPTAVASAPSTARAGTRVTLDGSASKASASHEWIQVAGPTVPLDLADPVRPWFMMPAGNTPLEFKLTTKNGDKIATGSTRVTPIAPTPTATPRIPVKAHVARAGYGNVLSVNIDPNRGAGSHLFQVQKRAASGKWATVSTQRTDGAGETKSLTLPAGSYRVVVPASGGYGAATSATVNLTRPTAKVRVGTDRARNQLVVNVDPNRGSGFFTFRVQKRNANGTWTTLRTAYNTQGAGETRTVNLGRGTYRAVVSGKYGYQAVNSAAVTLTR